MNTNTECKIENNEWNVNGNCRNKSIYRIVMEGKCCGCQLCQQVCTQGAISSLEKEDGFIYPVVHSEKCNVCGRCLFLCPMFNYKTEQQLDEFYGFSHKSEDVLLNSASGGVFTYVYERFIEAYPTGYVAGAVYSSDFKKVELIISDKKEDFLMMRGSKYFQADKASWGENGVYLEIKRLLNSGSAVLFTGCPCEVSALYNFLGKDYEKLWTMDFICKGASSPRILREYVAHIEKKKKSSVQYLNMRYKWRKIDNWLPQFLCIRFSDGTECCKEFYNTELGIGFQILQREGCMECPYRERNHRANFTIGDYHGAGSKDKCFNRQGTSIVGVNNAKGKLLWEIFEKEGILLQSVTKEKVYLKNRNSKDPRRDKLLREMEKQDSISAIRECISVKGRMKMILPMKIVRKKVGILTFHRVYNYGATIQAYSLQQFIKNAGYETEIIDFSTVKQRNHLSTICIHDGPKRFIKSLLFLSRYKERIERERSFNLFFNRLQLSSDLYRTESELFVIANYYSAVVVGSDQIWNVRKKAERSEAYFLNFVSDDTVKIAYAPSLGGASATDLQLYKDLLKKFDFLSCREEGGAKKLEEVLHRAVPIVVDPTLLVDFGALDKLTDDIQKRTDGDYILYYSLDGYDNRKRNLDTLRYLGEKLNAKILMVTPEWPYHKWPFADVVSAGPEEFLALIKNALLVCTNSFHGTALSICFGKPFFVLEEADVNDERKRSLLNQLDLNERIISSVDQIEEDKILCIDYSRVHVRLDELRNDSQRYILDALKHEKEQT